MPNKLYRMQHPEYVHHIEMDKTSRENLANELDAKTWEDRHMTQKEDIIEYYKDTYKSKWSSHLINDMLKVKGLENTKTNRNTISRQWQGRKVSRAHQKSTRNQKDWTALGKELPPSRVPKNLRGKRAQVKVKVYFTFSDGKPTFREFNRLLTQERTNRLLETGGPEAIIEQYGINPESIEEISDMSITIDFI